MTAAASSPQLSIIIPAYNEAERIRPTLEQYASCFSASYGQAFELVVVLNGCRDNTRSVVEEVMGSTPQLRVLEFPDPLGKGGAIWEGFATAHGERLAFADADNMVPAAETEKLVQALDRADLAIANRFGPAPQSTGGQSLARRLTSRALRAWVRLYLGLPYHDTQCGAKAFRASAWHGISPHVRERGWAFDLDVLTLAAKLGLTVEEVPVEWRHVAEGSKVQPWKAGPELLLATLRIRRRRRG